MPASRSTQALPGMVNAASQTTGKWLWWTSLFLVALLSIPLVVVLSSLSQPDWGIWRHLYDTVLTDYIVNSLILMAGVGMLALVWGVLPAWFVTMYSFPLSRIFEWGLLLPVSVPAYIIAYTYTNMLDVGGPVQVQLRAIMGLHYHEYWFPEVRSIEGAILLMSLVLYPYIYLLTRAAFVEQSVSALDAAKTLGCGGRDAFIKIALPLARPAMIVGLSLVLMETLADYGTVHYFGIPVFTTGIFRTWFGLGEELAAAQLSALMMVYVFILIAIERRSRKWQRYYNTGSRYGRINKKPLHGVRGIMAMIYCALPLLAGFIIPVAYLCQLAGDSGALSFDPAFIRLFQHSLLLALGASILALVLSLLIAYTHRVYHSAFTFGALRFVSMGYAIPGTVIAVGVLIPFAWMDNRLDAYLNAQFGVGSGLLFSGSLFILVFAYLVRYMAVSLNTVEAGLEKIRPSMDEAARLAGMNAARIIGRIHMPLMKGSLFTALLLVFVDVLKELPATLILRPFNFNTLAIRTYELANEERLAEASVPALAIVLAGIIPVILISRSISGARPGYEQGH